MSTNSVYIITSINPKDGVLQEIHEEMLYRKAYIIEANCGDAGLLKVLPPYDDRYHTFRTSPIVRCTPWHDEPDTIVMETKNTVYTLQKVGDEHE